MNINKPISAWDRSNHQDVLRTILMADDASEMIRNNLDIVLIIIPELAPMIGFDQMHPHHHLDVWEHTLLALNFAPKDDFDTKLAVLLHDIGKPHSWSFDGTVRHFYGHAKMSKIISQNILDRLGFPLEYKCQLLDIIERHDNALTEEDIESDYQISQRIFKLQVCDCFAHNPEKNARRLQYIKEISELFENCKNSQQIHFD